MFCVKCGKEIDDEAVFCPFCGVDLTAIVGGVDSNNSLSENLDRNFMNMNSCQDEVSKNTDNHADKSEKGSIHKEKKNKKLSAYSIAVIILFVVLIILCFLIKIDIFEVAAI